MADAMVSFAVERIATLLEETIRNEVNLVRGVTEEARSLRTELNAIRKVLDDAERRRFKEEDVNSWMRRLEHMAYEMEDVLDEWHYAILKLKMEHDESKQKKVCSFFIPSSSCLCFNNVVVRHDIATKIESVKVRLDKLLKEGERYKFLESHPDDTWRVQSTSLIDVDEVHGRDSDRDVLVNKLIMTNTGGGELGGSGSLRILSIVGVGGLGKTTLAQLAYNHDRVKESFELRIWICVSDPFDEAAIAKDIMESMKKGSSPDTRQLDILCKNLIECIGGKKFLLVLDDVWSEDYNKWEPLKNSLRCGGAAGSVILVTTRNEKVAKMMGTTEVGIHRLGQLSDDDCWLVLDRLALFGRNDEESKKLESIGKDIARKCKGLPLAAKTLGSLLRSKDNLEEWKDVLNSEIWDLENAKVDLFPHLLLSYKELSPVLKRCFSYCAVFPKDFVIEVDDVVRRWMAQGYLGFNTGNGNAGADVELKGREYFKFLAMRSLFQDFKKDDMGEQIESFKMHDIVHDFAQFLRKNSSSRVDDVELKKTTCRVCSNPLLFSSVKEYRSLFLDRDEPLQNLCDCLGSLRALGLSSCELQRIPQGMKKLIHLRWLYLSHNDALHGEDTTTICKLYNLQFLWITNCKLKKIPKKIGNLIHLRHLNLSHNKLLEIPTEIGNLIHLRHLNLSNNKLLEIPTEIWNLIQLRHLDVRDNDIKEISMEIGKLIHLRHLDVSLNQNLKELPESLCGLHELRTLIISGCRSLGGLPQGTFDGLKNLKHLRNEWTGPCFRFPQGLAQFTGLRTLGEIVFGSGSQSKLGWLKNLNSLSGSLTLRVRLSADDLEVDVVEDAREAELREKIHIQDLTISFEDRWEEEESSYSSSSSRVRMDVIIDALEPHPSLRRLEIQHYEGSKLPGWIASLNQLREIHFFCCNNLSSLSPLAKLPLLKKISISGMDGLEILGREFLFGTTITRDTEIESSSSSSSAMPAAAADTINIAAFPKLRALLFTRCKNWKEWEDITTEEEDSTTLSLMPSLKYLSMWNCKSLMELPHHLLRKLSSLKVLRINGSTQLKQRYGDKDGSAWKSISHNNPQLRLYHEDDG